VTPSTIRPDWSSLNAGLSGCWRMHHAGVVTKQINTKPCAASPSLVAACTTRTCLEEPQPQGKSEVHVKLELSSRAFLDHYGRAHRIKNLASLQRDLTLSFGFDRPSTSYTSVESGAGTPQVLRAGEMRQRWGQAPTPENAKPWGIHEKAMHMPRHTGGR
jgi:hypothetical protein